MLLLTSGWWSPYTPASFFGFITWALLSRRNVRGDRALAFFLCSVSALYAWIRVQSPDKYAFYEVASLSSVYLLSLAFVTVAFRLSPCHPLAAYPGPLLWKTSSLFLSLISLSGRRHHVLDKLHQQYGPFMRIVDAWPTNTRIAPNHLSINTPGAVSIYQNMEKSEAYRRPARIKVTTLFFKNETEKHHRDRKRIWSAMFTPVGTNELIPALEKRTWELMQCLERRQAQSDNGLVDLTLSIAHWSYDFMGDMVFGGASKLELMKNGDPKEYIMTGKRAMIALDSAGHSPWLLDILWRLPTSRSMRRLIENSRYMMHSRLQAKELPPYRDLSSYLIEAGLPQLDLEREALVAIQAGSDNTSITMSLVLFFMLAEPRYYQRLRAELEQTFANPLGPLPASDLATLPFLNAVIHETLRFSSPYFVPRVVPKGGAAIDGRFIPEGTIVALAAYSQQTSPDNFFPDPLEYRPERWVEAGSEAYPRTNKAVLASFSFGPHACIARNLAFQEMRYVLSRLVLAYDMALPKGFDTKAFRAGILNMRTTILEKKLTVRVERRPGVDLDAVLD
ncbi:cytochrome P450 [Trametes meyenii]|nr:cytochrome P450 [Trametes meyenii]